MAGPVDPPSWSVVNDTVMGGRSSGQIDAVDGGLMVFTGNLSLENNGGFASVRSRPGPLGLDEATSLKIRVRGDGRTWSVNLYRSDVPLRAGSYRAEFQTKPRGVTEVELPFAAFSPTSFGRDVPGLPALDSHPERVVQLGFLLGDKTPGPFTLTVLSVEATGQREARGDGAGAMVEALRGAIQQGVPLFNGGAIEACRDLYRAQLDIAADHPALTAGEKKIVDDALDAASAVRADQGAWILRYAMDSLLSGMTARG